MKNVIGKDETHSSNLGSTLRGKRCPVRDSGFSLPCDLFLKEAQKGQAKAAKSNDLAAFACVIKITEAAYETGPFWSGKSKRNRLPPEGLSETETVPP